MSMNRTTPQVSVIVPVGERQSPADALYAEYKSGLAALGVAYEVIFVLDGPQPVFEQTLAVLSAQGEPVTVICLSRYFGEATAIMVGFEHAVGSVIYTLPAYFQVDGSQVVPLYAALDNADVAVGYREPRASRWFEKLRRGVFHGMLQFVTQLSFRDLGCNARAMRRKVLEEIHLYGDQQRFLPVLAERQGFRIAEVPVAQSKSDRHDKMYPARNYLRSFLDIFTVFFLVRFTKKPLRFFGMIGVATLVIGLLELAYLVFERLVFGIALADRPAILLASLLIVLGVQIFALGLLGELIIFTHAGTRKEYQVDRIVHYADAGASDATRKSMAAPNQVKVVA